MLQASCVGIIGLMCYIVFCLVTNYIDVRREREAEKAAEFQKSVVELEVARIITSMAIREKLAQEQGNREINER